MDKKNEKNEKKSEANGPEAQNHLYGCNLGHSLGHSLTLFAKSQPIYELRKCI
jgi:hypothetical protein